jgi:hypothetical protein
MGPAKSKHFFGTRAAGVVFSSSTDGVTQSRDLSSAVQTVAGGVVIRCHTGTRNSSGVLDIDIYDSDDGLNFQKVASFTQITAAGDYEKDPGRRLRSFVRLDMILTSGTGFDDTKAWAEFTESRESGRPAGGIREA